MNEQVRTVVVVPVTSQPKRFPFRVPVVFADTAGELLTDHIRSVDKSRLVRSLGRLDASSAEALAAKLVQIFEV